jgi:sterol desaturase/sphingolipid hydroxylase (fatty acid hydroxylase superfamily)
MSAPVSLQIFVGFALFLCVFVPLEWLFPQRRQRAFRHGWSTDVAYYVAGCVVGKLSDTASMIAMLLIRHAMGMNADHTIASQPAWIQFFEVLVLADFLAYWCHRFLHRNAHLWRLHRVHHSSQAMDWLANVHLHPVDKLIGDCFQFVPIFVVGFADAPILAYTIFLGFQGFLNHSNIRLNYGPLRWIVASPEFHHWHHCIDPKAHDRNFSPHLVIFDRLFGTLSFPDDRSFPEAYGVPEKIPDGFWNQLLSPLRSLAPIDDGGNVESPARIAVRSGIQQKRNIAEQP